MPCPYLEGSSLKTCAAFDGIMVLPISELKDYCTTDRSFLECEFFKRAKIDSKNDETIEDRNS